MLLQAANPNGPTSVPAHLTQPWHTPCQCERPPVLPESGSALSVKLPGYHSLVASTPVIWNPLSPNTYCCCIVSCTLCHPKWGGRMIFVKRFERLTLPVWS